MPASPYPTPDRVVRRSADAVESARAARGWWDATAEDYYAEHGPHLGDAELTWGPEGWTEAQLGLLGDLTGADVLEVGAGAAQGARWCAAQGARVVATDLSSGMLRVARRLDAAGHTLLPRGYLHCDGTQLPLADRSVDVVFTAHGVLAFVPDLDRALREWCRVLRPGGSCVFSLPHPFRWVFPDTAGPAGLMATTSYFAPEAYVEESAQGVATYTEHHRTVGDLVRAIHQAGLLLEDLVEPKWSSAQSDTWGGGWNPERGALLPSTAIFLTRRLTDAPAAP